MTPRPSLSVVYVVGTYPLLTTTFIDREIAALRRRDVDVSVVSLRRPHGRLSPEQTVDDVEYVMPVGPAALILSHLSRLASAPVVYAKTLWDLATSPHPDARSRIKTVGHFVLAVHVARVVERAGVPDRIHAHFVDRAALVALVVGRFLGIPYSATAHANDIYVEPVLLERKVAEAAFVATCTAANVAHLERVVPAGGRIRCLHHGLDVDDYEMGVPAGQGPPLVLAVGQLKEKKGFAHLVEACRILVSRGRRFRCEVVGEGDLRRELESAIAAAGLGDVVVLRGALDHGAVKSAYAAADIFVLPCVVGSDGDRDGIPNVILEAMASGLPVVSTAHSGIPEAVDHGVSGLLAPPGDAEALADALARLLDDAELRAQYGEMGRKIVARSFDVTANADRLIEELMS